MSILWNYRKPDLKTLALELGIEVEETDKVADLIEKLEASPRYAETSAVAQLKIIYEDRKECMERNHELEKLRVSQMAETNSIASSRSEGSRKIASLTSVMQKFDHEKSDMALFLILFERQAKKAQIEDDQLVSQLLALLPIDIAEMIIREPEEKAEDFQHVKKILLDRFKLSPEAFRSKFLQHQKKPESLWKDLIFELRGYLEGWLEGVNITDFESLKQLMITDQLKRRAPQEAKEHMIDNWTNFVVPEILASKLDEYEAVRKPLRKNFKRSEPPRIIGDRKPKGKEEVRSETKLSENKPFNWRDKKAPDQRERERSDLFEKRRPPACYHCNSQSHLRPQCPLLKKEYVNYVGNVEDFDQSFKPYLSRAIVNGIETTLLRDSGSSIDIIPMKYIRPEQLNGESVWVKPALGNEFKCLPLANVELEIIDLGKIKTKAAVVDREIIMDHYLLGNQTQEQIETIRNNPQLVNAVITRSRTRKEKMSPLDLSGEQTSREENEEKPELELKLEEREENEPIIELPPLEINEVLDLMRINAETFRDEQQKDESLKSFFEKARQMKGSEFFLEKDILFRKSIDHRGIERKQLLIPKKFRNQILSLCHEDISAHVGTTKTKDKILRYYFWPQVIKEAEAFVRSCDPCQRIGKAREKKKAPLKLVPIIREVFSRINIDVVGPLPVTERNNKYILTAMCLASKYPEAIPMIDTKSETVVDALLIVFSRIGFPREIQSDLGPCFMSNLTSIFFEKFGINVSHSSPYHPESNPIERWHRTVKRLLKVLCLEKGSDWEKVLPAALLTLRTVTHESTGFSPAELVHGRNLRTPETLLFEKWAQPEEADNPVTEYVFEIMNRLKRCQELACEKMSEMQKKRKLWYDKGAIHRKFKPGDQVLVLAVSKPNKMAVSWIGPGVIETQISETNYVVKLTGKKERSQVYHINLLKPYYRRAETVNSLICENVNREMKENDLDIPYPSEEQNIYDFEEIVKESKLAERCTPTQLEQLKELLKAHREIFSNEPGRTDLIEHDIELISDKPVRSKPYRTSPRQAEILKAEIKRMLDLKIIEIGESDYTSPMILVEAPGKDPRPCIDYRKLNSITRTEYFPLPNIEERVEKVAAAKFITVIDLTKGYWQIPLSPRAQRLATFVTNFGTYRPLVMPFGLMTAPYRFSKFMANLLNGCEEFCVPYLDDIAIFSDTWEKHLEHLNCVLNRIKEAKLKIKPSKCKFAQDKVKYLGHMVGGGSRTPSQAKIQAVLDLPTPKTKTQIRQIMGMSNYYAKYIKNFAIITEPLTRKLKGKIRKEDIEWSEECESALNTLKQKLTEKPVLYAPDYSKEFILQTDASDKGIGVVMSQKGPGGEEHPIIYLSRKFSEPEKNYCTTEKECAGIIFAIKKLRHYLDGQKFKIETDHKPLEWLKTNAGNNPRLMRWALALQAYNYKVAHKSGKEIKHADCLSRMF